MNSAVLARRLLLVVVMWRSESKRPMTNRKGATMIRALAVAAAILMASWTQVAGAAPITYLGTLQSGVPVSDTVPAGGPNDPLVADYWQFTLTEQTQVTITGHRLDADLDMAFWVHRGTHDDTDEFGGSLANLAPLAFGDDDIAELPGLDGPYSDPRVILDLPEGTYTVSVVSYLSNGSGPFAYCLELNGPADSCGERQVPMPATLLLLGLGVIGSAAFRYGRF
jgi:hypothetical protein